MHGYVSAFLKTLSMQYEILCSSVLYTRQLNVLILTVLFVACD